MRRISIADNSRARFGQLLLAVLLGATAGLFISGYWLIDLFPADSRLLIGVSALAGIAASVAYYAAIGKMSRNRRSASLRMVLGWILAGAPLACFFFFAGTSPWRAHGRYVGFFLPNQEFSLRSAGAQAGTSIVWINTSFGDVSYDSLKYSGWIRRGDQMMLQDPVHNSMQWRGKAGERVEIVFESQNAGGDFQIRWSDLEEGIHLGTGKASYQRTFDVPFAASREFVLALGLLHFWLLSSAALWAKSTSLSLAHQPDREPAAPVAPRGDVRRELPILAALMGLALLLRAFNLGAVFPAVDEYYHLIAANQLLQGVPLDAVYPRGLWIVTIPVAAALRLLGHEIWVARVAGVLFNVLALIPLYALVRKVSRPAAISVGLLYATSPWIITFARVAREYAYYPLYFYLIVLAMVSFVERIPPAFVAARQWRQLVRPGIVLLALGLTLPPVFALRIDWLSTFRTVLIAYLVFGAFVMARFDWRARTNWPILGAVAVLFIWAGLYFYREQLTKLLLVPRVNAVPLQYFFPNPAQQWYYNRATLVATISLAVGVALAVTDRRVGVVPAFFAGLFGAYLAVFTLFSKSFFHTRHLISTQFWFVVLVGIGLYGLWDLLRSGLRWKGKVAGTVLALVLSGLMLNPNQILLPTLSRNPDMQISEDYLHDMTSVQAYLLGHVHDGDALISTVYGLYATWEGEPKFGQQYRINSSTTREEIELMAQDQEAGWIVIDSIRLDMSGLTERSFTDLPQMEYIGIFGDEHVWRWGRRLAGSPASDF